MEQIAGVGMLLYLFPKTNADGMVVMEHAEVLTERLVSCAKENDAFYKALSFLVTGTVWTALCMEGVTITGAILKNHGINPLALLTSSKKETTDGRDHVSGLPAAA